MRSARRARPTTSQSYAHLESIIQHVSIVCEFTALATPRAARPTARVRPAIVVGAPSAT